MSDISVCSEILRLLIAEGDVDELVKADMALNRYLEATPALEKIGGLKLLRQDVLKQRKDVFGERRNLADIVKIYIENKMSREPPVPRQRRA